MAKILRTGFQSRSGDLPLFILPTTIPLTRSPS
jgi:hypothetical protein